jgi:hypothetical protein
MELSKKREMIQRLSERLEELHEVGLIPLRNRKTYTDDG